MPSWDTLVGDAVADLLVAEAVVEAEEVPQLPNEDWQPVPQ